MTTLSMNWNWKPDIVFLSFCDCDVFRKIWKFANNKNLLTNSHKKNNCLKLEETFFIFPQNIKVLIE